MNPSQLEASLTALECEVENLDISYKLLPVRGIPCNPTFESDELENLISSFETRDTDVFVDTYVKSGTTWTQQVSPFYSILYDDGERPTFRSSIKFCEEASLEGPMVHQFLGWKQPLHEFSRAVRHRLGRSKRLIPIPGLVILKPMLMSATCLVVKHK